MEDYKNRRKNYYIKKEFQRSFILKFCLIVIMGSAISGAITYWMSRATVTTSFENLRLVIKSTADYILPAVLLSGIIVVAMAGIATIIITLFTSHKIAGPLYRIEKDIRAVASGNLAQEFGLRQGDEIKPMVEALRDMVHFLRSEVNTVKKAMAELEAIAVETGASEVMKQKIKALKTEIENLKT